MKIRRATKKDVQELAELDKEAHKEIVWWVPMKPYEFSRLIKKRFVDVAIEDGKIIGYINWNIKNNQLTLDNLYIKREFRKQGLGKKMINKFMSELKTSRFKEVRIDCPESLRKFYENLGFKVTGLIMKRKLR